MVLWSILILSYRVIYDTLIVVSASRFRRAAVSTFSQLFASRKLKCWGLIYELNSVTDKAQSVTIQIIHRSHCSLCSHMTGPWISPKYSSCAFLSRITSTVGQKVKTAYWYRAWTQNIKYNWLSAASQWSVTYLCNTYGVLNRRWSTVFILDSILCQKTIQSASLAALNVKKDSNAIPC